MGVKVRVQKIVLQVPGKDKRIHCTFEVQRKSNISGEYMSVG